MSARRSLGKATLGHLEGEIATVADDLRADRDQAGAQARGGAARKSNGTVTLSRMARPRVVA